MRISKKSQYGLRALVHMASKNKVCSLKEISKAEGIPFDFLEKILSKLRERRFVDAKKGKKGGYFLAKKSKDIRVGEIIRIFEGTLAPVLCVAKEKGKKIFCPRKKNCKTKNIWKKIQNLLKAALDSITLADIIKN